MDETEYEMYLKAVFGLDDVESDDSRRIQLRDDDGEATEGCYWIAPLPTE